MNIFKVLHHYIGTSQYVELVKETKCYYVVNIKVGRCLVEHRFHKATMTNSEWLLVVEPDNRLDMSIVGEIGSDKSKLGYVSLLMTYDEFKQFAVDMSWTVERVHYRSDSIPCALLANNRGYVIAKLVGNLATFYSR